MLRFICLLLYYLCNQAADFSRLFGMFGYFSQGFAGKTGVEGPQGPVGMYVSDPFTGFYRGKRERDKENYT